MSKSERIEYYQDLIEKEIVSKNGGAMRRLAKLLKEETPRERALRKISKKKNTY